ncbi:N-acetylmuramoyl-L-alanine amidase [Niabella sp. W65]|nr:N-acetylmuramoyl-L-alanine amidase [Niabella sp. W65]MCH7368565.1 N-acetylmuramoyl-L-alanine amidase [Niabella sp. W65]ULT44154.1 N-acetylmuramoyl-L-alanine amidase [Niabella sp. I65]
MRQIKYIVIHCTATPQTTTVKSIQNYWRNNLGWKMPGYHYIVNPNGTVISLLPIDQVSNGVAGYNSNSIHISYIGGVGAGGVPVDNRTDWQKRLFCNYYGSCVKSSLTPLFRGTGISQTFIRRAPALTLRRNIRAYK